MYVLCIPPPPRSLTTASFADSKGSAVDLLGLTSVPVNISIIHLYQLPHWWATWLMDVYKLDSMGMGAATPCCTPVGLEEEVHTALLSKAACLPLLHPLLNHYPHIANVLLL